jgi:hypothetical protein
MEEMEKTMKRGRNHSVMEGIEVEGIDWTSNWVKIVGLDPVDVEMIFDLESSWGLKEIDFFEMFILNVNGNELRMKWEEPEPLSLSKIDRISIVSLIISRIFPGIDPVMKGKFLLCELKSSYPVPNLII